MASSEEQSKEGYEEANRNKPFTHQQARILWSTFLIRYSLPVNFLLTGPRFVPICKRNTSKVKTDLFYFFEKIKLKHIFGNSDI